MNNPSLIVCKRGQYSVIWTCSDCIVWHNVFIYLLLITQRFNPHGPFNFEIKQDSYKLNHNTHHLMSKLKPWSCTKSKVSLDGIHFKCSYCDILWSILLHEDACKIKVDNFLLILVCYSLEFDIPDHMWGKIISLWFLCKYFLHDIIFRMTLYISLCVKRNKCLFVCQDVFVIIHLDIFSICFFMLQMM